MRFEALTSASFKIAVFWVYGPCSLSEIYRRFRDARRLHQDDLPEDGGSRHLSETSVSTSPEDNHFNFPISLPVWKFLCCCLTLNCIQEEIKSRINTEDACRHAIRDIENRVLRRIF